MLITPPAPIRKRQPKQQPTAATPPATVKVLGVYITDDSGAMWIFSSPVTVTDESPSPQLRIQTDSGWQSVINLGDVDTYLAAGDYNAHVLDASGGQAWEVTEVPEGLDFGGVPFELPQSGTTVGTLG